MITHYLKNLIFILTVVYFNTITAA